MSEKFIRTEMLLGKEALENLSHKKVAIFGVGGVGGYVCEALVRCGIGAFDIIDNDTVAESNLNRQIIALCSNLGRSKVEVMKERMQDINPDVKVSVHECFFLPENSDSFDFSEYDYVVDCVDTVTAKLEIIMKAKEAGVPIISSMGTGNKLDPTKLQISDIYKTSIDPLSRVMRRELKKRGVKSLKVVFSTEDPLKPKSIEEQRNIEVSQDIINDDTQGKDINSPSRRSTPGSVSFVPSVAGLIIASEVIKDLTRIKN
ncbi:MAG: tRNA threonylcarbamoyladenosine dehydratase [Butyrivibrio sp.]|nr:tRNA threonylcarbamoyladenosine dehydratase [Butyrivibrio sp.]MBQ6415878.1 tRNA threonylcarbamoyladenosine dehydratase [Butyrivibrio sp.]